MDTGVLGDEQVQRKLRSFIKNLVGLCKSTLEANSRPIPQVSQVSPSIVEYVTLAIMH